jgi:hypothetical protein
MKPNESRVSSNAGRFRTTHWILLAAQMLGSRTALADLCRPYTDLQAADREIYTLCEVLIASEGRLVP